MSGAAGRPARPRRSRWSRLLSASWFLAAGYVLFLAPLTDMVWNESFWSDLPRVQSVLLAPWARHGTCALGAVLLAAGLVEVVGLLLAEGNGASEWSEP